jgi:hypothetical protein
MVNCNCKIVTRLKIPEYGPPSIWTPNMNPQNGPQIWTPPIIWDDVIMGKSWGNHGESMGMPLGRQGKLEINCGPK